MGMQTPPDRPTFVDPVQLVVKAFSQFEVPERMSISEAAERYRILDNPGGGYSGPWTYDAAPFLRRPTDCLDPESPYTTTALIGPAQSGKSEIGNNWILHTAKCDQADMIFLAPDKEIMRSYVVSQINKMIDISPVFRGLISPESGANNIFHKKFIGCNLFNIWPVKSQMRARPAPKIRIDDYDAIAEDIEGEGNAIVLLSGRQTTFEGHEKFYVNSSPALGPQRGIEALVKTGTDERFFVPCRFCNSFFDINFEDHLHFENQGTSKEAAESAVVVCPECGGIHEQKHKMALMTDGVWLGREQTITDQGRIIGDLRPTDVAGFWVDGLMGFASWGKLARMHRDSELAFENSQDEEPLKAFINTRVGRNYISRVETNIPVSVDELESRASISDYCMGQVPEGVVCLTAAVDIQGGGFEVMIKGWAPGWESYVIDRFSLTNIDHGRTKLNPARNAKHWAVLIKQVLWRRWPMKNNDRMSLPILNMAVDTGGQDGVTNNAFAFWHTAINMNIPQTGITLIKGGNNVNARLLPPPTIDTKRQGPKGTPQCELFIPNVHRLKNMVDLRLRQTTPGPGFIHFPNDIDPQFLAEYTAEHKEAGLWVRPPNTANESWDLEVYNNVCLLRLGGNDTGLSWVPEWARPLAKPPTQPPTSTEEIEPLPKAAKAKARPRIRVR